MITAVGVLGVSWDSGSEPLLSPRAWLAVAAVAMIIGLLAAGIDADVRYGEPQVGQPIAPAPALIHHVPQRG